MAGTFIQYKDKYFANGSAAASELLAYTSNMTSQSSHTSQGFWAINKATGANTVTASFSGAGGTFVQLTIVEYSGANTVDTSAFANSVNQNVGQPITTLKTDGVVLGYVDDGVQTVGTPAGSWTLRTVFSDTNKRTLFLDQLNIAPGTYSPSLIQGVTVSAGTVGFYFVSSSSDTTMPGPSNKIRVMLGNQG